ncbi:hypothetical protein Tco_1258007, partial [Tanacetum coccineum]
QDFVVDGLEELDSKCDDLHLHTTSIFKADHVDVFDSDYDKAPTASAMFMARLSPACSVNRDDVNATYDSDILSKTEYFEHLVSNNDSYDEPESDSNVISYAEYMVTIKNDVSQSVPPPEQDNAMILSVIEQMLKQSAKSSLEIELLNQQESNKSFNELSKRFAKLEEYCISLELSLQHNKEKMISDESWKIHDASLITEINNKYFEINDLKAQLQDKSIIVNELKQLLAKLKGNSQVTQSETPDFDSRIESEPINAYFKNNMVVHQDYRKVTKEHIKTLQELLEHARALKPLDENLDYACKFAQRIQELLVYVCAFCHYAQSENEKWALATSHKNNNKTYLDTSRTNKAVVNETQKHAVKQNTQRLATLCCLLQEE